MAEFIPAILETDFNEIKRKLKLLEGQVDWVQIDIADGDFVPDVTWSDPAALAALNGQLKIEVHLMTRTPELELKDWLLAADRIIFHHEATTNSAAILDLFEHSPVEKIVALLLETPLEVIAPYADRLDGVQLMGIANVGQQGQPFDEQVIERVQELRRRYVDLSIGIDGGVNLQNAPQLIAAGANRLAVGSAFWQVVKSEGLESAIHRWSLAVGSDVLK